MEKRKGKYLIAFLVFLFSSSVVAQTTKDLPKKEPFKIIERIVGTWKLQRIDERQNQKDNTGNKKGGKSTAETPGTNSLQVLEFDPEGRYKANSSTRAQDSGSYRINEQHGLLYMESDADDITPTQWAVTIQRNIMTLEGRDDSQGTKGPKYVYIKTKEGLSTIKE